MSSEANVRHAVTLAEVAREAGVSPSTVSRIVNGSAGVKDAKAERVRRAIAKLGYRPNAFARSLVTGASQTIGVLTQDVASPFYADALTGIERGLSGSNYYPLFISGHWLAAEEQRAVGLLLNRRVDGLIVLGGQLADTELLRLAAQVPIAVVGRSLDLSQHGGVSITLDNRQAAADLVNHLLDRGHRQIGMIVGPQDHQDARERLQGYQDALSQRGLPFVKSMTVHGDFRDTSGLIGTQLLLSRHPEITAIFSSNDQMAFGARLALHRMGLRVPEDISLVGFDDLPGVAYMTPPLTTVRQPMAAIGEWAARFMVARLNGMDVPPLSVSLELQFRESVAFRRSS